MIRNLIPLLVLVTAAPAVADNNASLEANAPFALRNYVRQLDQAFHWEHVNTSSYAAGNVYQLRVTSQRWHDLDWTHAVELYEPTNVRYPQHAMLFVTGGSHPSPPGQEDVQLGLKLAAICGARVVMLHQTPNQPLLGNRKEDDLISETWLRYLDTGDDTWPLLFPMVKRRRQDNGCRRAVL